MGNRDYHHILDDESVLANDYYYPKTEPASYPNAIFNIRTNALGELFD